MYDNMETQSCTHDANAHAQIAGGTNLNFKLAENSLNSGEANTE